MAVITKKNITIDDVRQALAGDGDSEPLNPHNTNAHAVRKIIGRGSFGTIQKHLITIRDELMKSNGDSEQEHAELPDAPESTMTELWKSACLTAQAKLLERCDSLNKDRDALRASLDTINDDYAAAISEIDSLEASITQKDSELDEAMNKASEAANEAALLKVRVDELHKQNDKLTALIERSMAPVSESVESKPARKQRTTITDEIRADVLKMVGDGQKDDDIANSTGISVASVHKIKKESVK